MLTVTCDLCPGSIFPSLQLIPTVKRQDEPACVRQYDVGIGGNLEVDSLMNMLSDLPLWPFAKYNEMMTGRSSTSRGSYQGGSLGYRTMARSLVVITVDSTFVKIVNRSTGLSDHVGVPGGDRMRQNERTSGLLVGLRQASRHSLGWDNGWLAAQATNFCHAFEWGKEADGLFINLRQLERLPSLVDRSIDTSGPRYGLCALTHS